MVINLHESIFAAFLLEGGVIRGHRLKSGDPFARAERLDTMMAQFWRAARFFRESEDIFGLAQNLTVHYNTTDALIFPVILNGRPFEVVALAKPPYVHEELTSKIGLFLGEMRRSKQ